MLGERPFMAFSTSRWINVSSGVLFAAIEAVCGKEDGGALFKASGAAFSRAFLLRSCSRSLQRVVNTSTVSARSFLSVASSVIFNRHASRSTLRLSFSKSSGLRAGDFDLVFFWAGAFVLQVGGMTAETVRGAFAVSCDVNGAGGEAVADAVLCVGLGRVGT